MKNKDIIGFLDIIYKIAKTVFEFNAVNNWLILIKLQIYQFIQVYDPNTDVEGWWVLQSSSVWN